MLLGRQASNQQTNTPSSEPNTLPTELFRPHARDANLGESLLADHPCLMVGDERSLGGGRGEEGGGGGGLVAHFLFSVLPRLH